jgi:hypothetical protein
VGEVDAARRHQDGEGDGGARGGAGGDEPDGTHGGSSFCGEAQLETDVGLGAGEELVPGGAQAQRGLGGQAHEAVAQLELRRLAGPVADLGAVAQLEAHQRQGGEARRGQRHAHAHAGGRA